MLDTMHRTTHNHQSSYYVASNNIIGNIISLFFVHQSNALNPVWLIQQQACFAERSYRVPANDHALEHDQDLPDDLNAWQYECLLTNILLTPWMQVVVWKYYPYKKKKRRLCHLLLSAVTTLPSLLAIITHLINLIPTPTTACFFIMLLKFVSIS